VAGSRNGEAPTIGWVNPGPNVHKLRAWQVKRPRFDRLRKLAEGIRNNASLVRLVEMPLTIAGACCFSIAAFLGNEIAGFSVTGVCLVVIELMISDPETSEAGEQ